MKNILFSKSQNTKFGICVRDLDSEMLLPENKSQLLAIYHSPFSNAKSLVLHPNFFSGTMSMKSDFLSVIS